MSVAERRPLGAAAGAFLAWTLFVWGQRIVNILRGGESLVTRGTLALTFVVAAIAVIVLAVRRTSVVRPVLWGLISWTVVVWIVRVVAISVNPDHVVGFKVVHAVLAVVSIGLAAWAAAGLRRDLSPVAQRPVAPR